LGLAKKDKQLDERKLCSFFAKSQKQIGVVYFSSITNYQAVKTAHPIFSKAVNMGANPVFMT
jgi:hypothetical protein